MGLLNDVLGVLAGPNYVGVPLEPGESVVTEKVAGLLVGGKSIVGGKLVLTNWRLLFQPWDTRAIGTLLAHGLTKAGAPGTVGTVIGKVADMASTPSKVQLQSLSAAWASRDELVLSPPAPAVQLTDGSVHEFGILGRSCRRTSYG
ncbi:MAG: hypothetical protein H0W30_17560 [Gemmatimonadaceae bacterium]|nr:hypothetical protein [Gemmatimonadaceae bacterium]